MVVPHALAQRLGQVGRIEPDAADRFHHPVGRHARDIAGVDQVGRGLADQQLLVLVRRVGLLGGDEARAEIGQVRAQHLGRADHRARRDCARHDDGAIIDRPDARDQRQVADRARMAAAAGADAVQPVRPGRDGLLGEAQAGDVVEHLAAKAVHVLDQFGRIAADADDDLDAVFGAEGHVGLQLILRHSGRIVDRDRRDARLGNLAPMRRQRLGELDQPGLELLEGAGVLARQAADDPGLAGLAHERGACDQEHRGADRWQRQAGPEFCVQGPGGLRALR